MKKLVFFCLPFLATAAPIFTWSFDQPTGVVGPYDVIAMAGTFTNVGTSEGFIPFLQGNPFSSGSFYPSYSFAYDTSSPIYLSAFPPYQGPILRPGETIS